MPKHLITYDAALHLSYWRCRPHIVTLVGQKAEQPQAAGGCKDEFPQGTAVLQIPRSSPEEHSNRPFDCYYSPWDRFLLFQKGQDVSFVGHFDTLPGLSMPAKTHLRKCIDLSRGPLIFSDDLAPLNAGGGLGKLQTPQ